ncbi:MAG: hypothetical protein HY901_37085 [Deltaproteobacteria bacterium]|nr:hypothetical protein [Deltaproteobacteria bacterium]
MLLRLEAVVFVALALLALAYYLRLPSSLPSEVDYRAVAADLTARAGPGDAVFLDPHWAERARLFVPSPVPVLNLARRPTREDLRGYGRLFVLSLPDLPRSDMAKTHRFLESIQFRRAGETVRHGELALTLFENARVERPSFDFTGQVAQAKVYIRRPDGSQDLCPERGGRHPCPRAGWINVGEEIKEIDSKPLRCLWAHPAGNEPLVVEYADVPLGRTLDVVGGIVGQIVYRRERYGTTTLRVKIDGELAAELEFPPGEPGERRRSIDTSAKAGAPRRVHFEVSAPNPDMRHFCFDAGVYP